MRSWGATGSAFVPTAMPPEDRCHAAPFDAEGVATGKTRPQPQQELPLLLLPTLALGRPPTRAARDEEHKTALSRFAIRVIEGYRRWLSGRLGIHCRFEPSCSTYGLEAYQTSDFMTATTGTISRVVRCNPWNRGPVVDPLR
jgi:putative membrane protein insertion efficiency factor